MFCILKKKKYIWHMFQNNSNCEKQVILLMISNGALFFNDFKQSKTMALSCN